MGHKAVGNGSLSIGGREVRYRRLGREFKGVPLVFLHEGLGSVELWRDFPDDVVNESELPGLAYSRRGNGWSDPLTDPRRADYMHQEALETLPQVVEELVERPPILIGHSDGASIALIYAGAGHPVAGLVLIAPHVFVEAETVRSIQALRDGFGHSNMGERMAKWHTDPDSTFYGWADIWLSAEFLTWNIEDCLPNVRCPVLLIQGDGDEYGTLGQLEAIEAGVSAPTERVVIESAGHSPHLTHPQRVTDAVVRFVRRITK